jgi:hypothetical protein
LKRPKQKINAPSWIEDRVRVAIDRNGGLYRDPLRAHNLAAEIGAAEKVVRRAVKIRYEEMDG